MKRLYWLLFVMVLGLCLSGLEVSAQIPPQVSPGGSGPLVGRWEGTMKKAAKVDHYAMEIFAVGSGEKGVKVRNICPSCTGSEDVYLLGSLNEEKGKIGFNLGGIPFTLENDHLTGNAPDGSVSFSLQRISQNQGAIDPRLLVGKWILGTWGYGNRWWELRILDVNPQAGTVTGNHWTGWGRDYDLTDVNLAVVDNRLSLTLTTLDGALRYHLTYSPVFSSHPPVLWGTLKKDQGTTVDVMFIRRDTKSQPGAANPAGSGKP